MNSNSKKPCDDTLQKTNKHVIEDDSVMVQNGDSSQMPVFFSFEHLRPKPDVYR